MPVLPRRFLVLLALVVGVSALHWATLSVLGPGLLDPETPLPPPVRAIAVRSVVLPLPLAAPAQGPRPLAPASPVPRLRAPVPAASAAARAEAPTEAPTDTLPASVVVVVPEPAAGAAPTTLAAAPAVAVAVAVAVADPPAPTIEVPVYPTQLPPPGRWHYRLQRGLVTGEGELQWTLEAGTRYALRLEGRVAGVTVLDWASRGALDSAGIAPERFAIRRRGRDTQAANFQRDAGKITFSGPTTEAPLLPGAQDRLSWMLQLAGIVAAQPEQFTAAGARIVLFVAGARGDADVWAFVVQGTEGVNGVAALKLLREPRKPLDTRVEVWLDPADHHLPLRALLTEARGGASLELLRARE